MHENPVILSLETSGATCGVALSRGNSIIAEYSLFGNNLHDKFLAEFCRRICSDQDILLSELDAVAVSSGPGSFTGLRIGAAVAKGLCFGGNPKLISVSTLDSLFYSVHRVALALSVDKIIAVIPSQKDTIFMQIYDVNYDLVNSQEYDLKLINRFELKEYLNKNILLIGIAPNEDEDCMYINLNSNLQAKNISEIAYLKYQNNVFIDSERYVPNYGSEFEPTLKTKK